MKTINVSRRKFAGLFPEGLKIIEIGVFKGSYSRALFNSKPSHLTLVDIWQHIETETVYSKFDSCNGPDEEHIKNWNKVKKMFEKNDNVEIVRDFSENYVKNIPDGHFDVIYIDADHSYEGLTRDLNNWKNKITKNGFIYGHDYTDKLRWIEVPRALHDFLEKHKDFEFVAITNEAGSPSWMIARKHSILFDILKKNNL